MSQYTKLIHYFSSLYLFITFLLELIYNTVLVLDHTLFFIWLSWLGKVKCKHKIRYKISFCSIGYSFKLTQLILKKQTAITRTGYLSICRQKHLWLPEFFPSQLILYCLVPSKTEAHKSKFEKSSANIHRLQSGAWGSNGKHARRPSRLKSPRQDASLYCEPEVLWGGAKGKENPWPRWKAKVSDQEEESPQGKGLVTLNVNSLGAKVILKKKKVSSNRKWQLSHHFGFFFHWNPCDI